MVGTFDVNWLINNRLAESWAVGVETVITNDIYNTNDYERRQNYKISQMSNGYTCLVWDLIDDWNQHGTDPEYPNDQVEYYTLSQIEDALPHIFGSWWTWRDNLKNKYVNPSEGYLDILFQDLP